MLKEKEVRISLDDKAFESLVRGGQVSIGNTKIILQDIGFDLMSNIIHHANKGGVGTFQEESIEIRG